MAGAMSEGLLWRNHMTHGSLRDIPPPTEPTNLDQAMGKKTMTNLEPTSVISVLSWPEPAA